MTTQLSFPLSGYHRELSSSNTHSIFELVTKDEMHTVPTSEELSDTAKVALCNALADVDTDNIGDVIGDVEDYIQEGAVPPFGWMGLATKKDGLEYQGSFIKRFMSWAWKTHHVKFPASFASNLGSIIGKDVSKGVKAHYIRFDPIMRYLAGAFGDDGSCFWESRQGARMLIRNNGGSFIEFFDCPEAHLSAGGGVVWGNGLGRCWILPINQFLDAKFRREYAFVVCNFYADDTTGLNSYNMARSVANALGMGYNKIDVRSNLDTLWINSGHGFLLSNNQELINEVGYVRLDWSESEYGNKSDPELAGLIEHECANCGDSVSDDDWYSEYELCQSCYDDRFHTCNDCGNDIDTENDRYGQVNGNDICQNCMKIRGFIRCYHCGEWKASSEIKRHTMRDMFRDESDVCDDCARRFYHTCETCGSLFTQVFGTGDNPAGEHDKCTSCLRQEGYSMSRCQNCGNIIAVKEGMTTKERNLCHSCQADHDICGAPGCLRVVHTPDKVCSRHFMWA